MTGTQEARKGSFNAPNPPGFGFTCPLREIIKSWHDWIEQLKGNGVSWDEEDELYHNPVELRQ